MLNWDESYNWSYENLVKVLHNTFEVDGKDVVHLDVEHSDRKNMDDLIKWSKELGYEAYEVNMDTIRVTKKD